MSSKILGADDPREISLPAWRQVQLGESAAQSGWGQAPQFMVKQSPRTPQQSDPAEDIARIQKQCEQRVAEAHAAGQRDGETAGRNRAAAELQPVIERLTRSMEEVAGLRTKLRREAESDMIRLSLAIARRVLRRELSMDPEAMHGLVLGALEKLQAQEISRVRVHPSHVSVVSACLRQATAGNAIEVIGDPTKQPGAAVFETTHGNLDASVDTQLQEIERGLTDRLARQT